MCFFCYLLAELDGSLARKFLWLPREQVPGICVPLKMTYFSQGLLTKKKKKKEKREKRGKGHIPGVNWGGSRPSQGFMSADNGAAVEIFRV